MNLLSANGFIGNLFSAHGNMLSANGNFLPANGNLLSANGNLLSVNGNLLSGNGNLLPADGNLLSGAFRSGKLETCFQLLSGQGNWKLSAERPHSISLHSGSILVKSKSESRFPFAESIFPAMNCRIKIDRKRT